MHFFSPLNTFSEEREDPEPDPDPYLWLKDPDSDSCIYSLVTVTSCMMLHRCLGAECNKIPEGGTSTYILHLSVQY